MANTDLSPDDLAARVAARVCHDILSPVSANTAGVSFMAEASDSAARAEAQDLLGAGLAGLEQRLAFYRLALGRGEARQEAEALARLAAAQFADLRPTLDWAVTAPSLPGGAARAALQLALILGESLASGGEARISASTTVGRMVVTAEGTGARVRLHPETRAGLTGGPCPEGPGGRWAFAAFLRAQVLGAGGEVSLDAGDENIVLTVSLPVAPD